MKKVLAVLIAALMICLTFVPAQAATLVDFLPYAKLICEAIKTFSTAGADIHKAYADTLKQAMDYRMYYNQQGLAKAYEQMEVSMMNRGTPSYNSILNTTNNTFYDMSRDYTYTYNTAYYNNTYNSYYIPVTYNDVDYNYFITYAPTYTNITYIVDGCNDPSQAVSNNYYFQLPDGRNSYDLTADEVFGIPLTGDIINYDAVPENDSCVALFHFDGDVVDASGLGVVGAFSSGSVPQYTSVNRFGSCLTFSDEGYFSVPVALNEPYTVEFRLNLGQYVVFPCRTSFSSKFIDRRYDNYRFAVLRGVTTSHMFAKNKDTDGEIVCRVLNETVYNHNASVFSISSDGVERFGLNYRSGDYSTYNIDQLRFYTLAASSYSSPVYGSYLELDRSDIDGSLSAAFKVLDASFPPSFDAASFTFDGSLNSLGIPQGQWVSCAYVYDGSTARFFVNGVDASLLSRCFVSVGDLDTLTLHGCCGFSYTMFDEVRISKGALYTENYTPATAPFDIPTALVLPSEKAEGTIAVKSAVPVANVRLGGVRPSYPAQGDVYISLDADKKVTSCQQYQSGTWTECQGSVCSDDAWVDLAGYSFAGQVVNEDDFAEVVDKKDDPAAGIDANPEAEATSFIVHYYKEGTTDKVRRDTVYENLAVGAAFTVSAPTVKGYKALAASADITVTADGEYTFYYSVDENTDPGGSGGEDDPSKPGFFDGLLSGVKSLVNVICGFVGGVVQAVLSGITGIISTLIEAFKAVLSLGGHFGDFLAAALGFVPREIIDLLIAGIAVSIALAIVKFIRG